MGHRLPLRRPRHRASVYAAAWQRRTCVESSDCLCSMDILGHLVAFRADLHSVIRARLVRHPVSGRRALGIRQPARSWPSHSALDALGRLAVCRVFDHDGLRPNGQRLSISQSGIAGSGRFDRCRHCDRISLRTGKTDLCKYLCPVNGVFALLAKLAPVHFKVDPSAWQRSYTQGEQGRRAIPVNCAPLVPLRHMQGNAACHMCARCSGHRDAIALARRSPSDEVVRLGQSSAHRWDTVLIAYGLCGLAVGAFQWTLSPWFIAIKQTLAGWLIERDILWPFNTNAPWFLLTHYPRQNDVFNWL